MISELQSSFWSSVNLAHNSDGKIYLSSTEIMIQNHNLTGETIKVVLNWNSPKC